MTKPTDTLSLLVGLKHVEDWRSIGIVVFTILSLTTSWKKYTSDQPALLSFAIFAFNGLFCWYCATIVHNSIHVPPFKQRWKNSIWQCVLTIPYGFAVSVLIPGHNLSHHRHSNGPKDVMRTDRMQYKNNFMNLIMFFPTIVPLIQVQDNAYMWDQRRKGTPLWYQTVREYVFFLSFSLVLLFSNWRKWAICIFAPQMIAKWGLMIINMLQHDALPEPEDDKYNFSRNFTDPILNFFTCNNGYHTIHHMSPGTHWSRYEELHNKKVKPFIHPNLDQTSIISFFIKRFLLPNGRTDMHGNLYVPKNIPPDEYWFDPKTKYETYSDGSKY